MREQGKVREGSNVGARGLIGRVRRSTSVRSPRVAAVVVRLGLAICLGASAASAAEGSKAAGPSSAQIDYARALFAEGQALMEEREWLRAADKFREASRIKNTPGLHYYMALCSENAGLLLQAKSEYEEAHRLLAEIVADDVAQLVPSALERVDAAIPRIRIVLPPEVRGGRVDIDGKAVDFALLGSDLRVDPGIHSLRAEAVGYEPLSLQFEAKANETHTIRVELIKSRPLAPPPVVHKEAPPESSGWRTGTLIGSASLAAAGLGVGIWGLVERASAAEDVGSSEATVRERAGTLEGACSPPSAGVAGPCAELQDALDAQDRATALAVGGLVTAVTGVTATVVTLLFWPERSVTVDAAVAPGRFGLTLSGSL